jgi:hypothetical protein
MASKRKLEEDTATQPLQQQPQQPQCEAKLTVTKKSKHNKTPSRKPMLMADCKSADSGSDTPVSPIVANFQAYSVAYDDYVSSTVT